MSGFFGPSWRRRSFWFPRVSVEAPEVVVFLRCALRHHRIDHRWGMSPGGPYTEMCRCGHRHGDTYTPDYDNGGGYVKVER